VGWNGDDERKNGLEEGKREKVRWNDKDEPPL